MNTTQTDRLAEYTASIFDGLALQRHADSALSADRCGYHPMMAADEYSRAIVALGRVAALGDFYASAVSFALVKVSPFLNSHQAMAGIATAFASVVRDGWYDTATATGPEAGRPSSHQHDTTETQAILLLLALTEVGFAFRSLGYVPGIGWALRELIEQRTITTRAAYFPNVAAQLSK